jgi:hypothetical protein
MHAPFADERAKIALCLPLTFGRPSVARIDEPQSLEQEKNDLGLCIATSDAQRPTVDAGCDPGYVCGTDKPEKIN